MLRYLQYAGRHKINTENSKGKEINNERIENKLPRWFEKSKGLKNVDEHKNFRIGCHEDEFDDYQPTHKNTIT